MRTISIPLSRARAGPYSPAMQQAFPWLVIIAAVATLIVLVFGVLGMLRQGEFNARRSNRLMRYRIVFQFVAIALIAIAFLFGNK